MPSYCKNCGAELSSDAEFCPECGVEVGEVQRTTKGDSRRHRGNRKGTGRKDKPEKSSRRPIIKWAAVAAAVGILVLMLSTDDPSGGSGAAQIGTFVLGLGENVESTASAGISTEQTAGTSFTVTVVDSGNLDTAGIVGPDGRRSAFFSTEDALAAGAQLEVKRGGFDDVRETDDGTNLVGNEECRIAHSAEVVSGVQVDRADIGCSGEQLEEYAQNNPSKVVDSDEAEAIYTGQRIGYEAGAEYSFVGTVDGSEQVVQAFTTE